MSEFDLSPEQQLKKSEIETAFEHQQDTMRWYKEAVDSVKSDVRSKTGANRNNYQQFKKGNISLEEADAMRRRSMEVSHAREALDKADEQLKQVSEKYADGDPGDLPPSLL